MYQMIIEKMVEIIHQIGSKAIASQISSETQKEFLKNIHIDYLQGPLFYEPFEIKNTHDQFITPKDHLC
jgi:EAL domain-containing protein (putative c-di-GMP-specific phosphodiesterase class I)